MLSAATELVFSKHKIPMNTRVATSVHLASDPCRGSRFGFDSRCDLERTIRVKYISKLINITAGHKACRKMAQCCIDQSTFDHNQHYSSVKRLSTAAAIPLVPGNKSTISSPGLKLSNFNTQSLNRSGLEPRKPFLCALAQFK